jgi:hypothetical protein
MLTSRNVLRRDAFRVCLLIVGCCALLRSSTVFGWGPRAHRIVCEKAIEGLPPEMKGFFAANRAYLIEHSWDAEKLATTNRAEAVRHYIYFDRYGKYPFLLLPHNYIMARQQHGGMKLNKNGILPWYVGEYHLRLTEAFRSRNWDSVRVTSAWLAHYVADVTDPFHLTENYNGQLSGQTGIGDRMGSGLFDRYANFLLLRPGRIEYLKDPTENAFQIGLQNYVWVDNFLLADRLAFEAAGRYNEDYFERLYNEIGSVVSREISEAIENVGSYWYTAWVNAGKPPLPPQ